MNLLERCIEICNRNAVTETEIMTPICITENSNMTFPPRIIEPHSFDMKWFCKHVYYISDIHLVHKIVKKFKKKATDEQIIKFVKKIAKELITPEVKEHLYSYEDVIVLFGGDISSDFELAKIFYTEFMTSWKKELEKGHRDNGFVFSILGNHEFWDFDNSKDCYKAYGDLFKALGINFLNNSINWFGSYQNPMKRIIDNRTGRIDWKPFYNDKDEEEYRENNSEEYDEQMRYIHNMLIIGGVGFAGYNKEFNADQGIYRQALTRKEEIKETKKWEETYKNAVQFAKERNCVLIVLTHNPINDWNEAGAEGNCIYFNGHNHRNDLQHDDENNIHIFADNQIGYHRTQVQFKEAYIYKRRNPFAMYSDGCHEVKSSDYLRFYDFMKEKITGNGMVERQIKNNNGHFYMIKHKGYYGFFLESDNGTYICAGGTIKKLDKHKIIESINQKFEFMIQKYSNVLSPYRNAQEQIAEVVKALGGEGKIHGYIIDIDFFNHIMLNPNDGSITYYYSPMFGLVEKHKSLISLLDNHNILLAEQYRKLIGTKECDIVEQTQVDISGELVKINIKNSLYTDSGRFNQLQRLFDKKILRDWNEELLLIENLLIE